MHDERCAALTTEDDCIKEGRNAFSDGVCDWVVAEIGECECTSYQDGAMDGERMCQFGNNCAIEALQEGGACPENAVICRISIDTEETAAPNECVDVPEWTKP